MATRDRWSRLVMSMIEFSPQIKEDTSQDPTVMIIAILLRYLWICCGNGVIEHQKIQGSQVQILRALIELILILAITVSQIPLPVHKMSTKRKNGYYFYLLHETDNLLFLACYIYYKTILFKKLWIYLIVYKVTVI